MYFNPNIFHQHIGLEVLRTRRTTRLSVDSIWSYFQTRIQRELKTVLFIKDRPGAGNNNFLVKSNLKCHAAIRNASMTPHQRLTGLRPPYTCQESEPQLWSLNHVIGRRYPRAHVIRKGANEPSNPRNAHPGGTRVALLLARARAPRVRETLNPGGGKSKSSRRGEIKPPVLAGQSRPYVRSRRRNSSTCPVHVSRG